MIRKGHVTRTHDFGPFNLGPHTFNLVISCVGEFICNGSHKWPVVTFYVRHRKPRKDMNGWSKECTHVESTKRINVPLPYIKWATGYRYRKALPFLSWMNRGFNKLYYWAFVYTYRQQVEAMREAERPRLSQTPEYQALINDLEWLDRNVRLDPKEFASEALRDVSRIVHSYVNAVSEGVI